eukprot:10887895-Alexandrium_andersonii.AAC.1
MAVGNGGGGGVVCISASGGVLGAGSPSGKGTGGGGRGCGVTAWAAEQAEPLELEPPVEHADGKGPGGVVGECSLRGGGGGRLPSPLAAASAASAIM